MVIIVLALPRGPFAHVSPLAATVLSAGRSNARLGRLHRSNGNHSSPSSISTDDALAPLPTIYFLLRRKLSSQTIRCHLCGSHHRDRTSIHIVIFSLSAHNSLYVYVTTRFQYSTSTFLLAGSSISPCLVQRFRYNRERYPVKHTSAVMS